MDAARAGSNEAAHLIVREYLPYLAYWIHRYYPSWNRPPFCPGASSVVQMTVYDLLQGAPRYQGKTVEELHGWLLTLIRNNCTDALRQRRRVVQRFVPLDGIDQRELASVAAPAELAEKRELMSRIEDATQQLPEPARQVIKLRFREGLRFEEIGRRLQCSAKAAQKICERALQTLRRQLKDE